MKGKAEISEVFNNYLAQFHTVYHLNGQQTVKFINENHAEGISSCQVALVSEQKGKDVLLTHYVRYADSDCKTGGTWQIAKRVANLSIAKNGRWRNRL